MILLRISLLIYLQNTLPKKIDMIILALYNKVEVVKKE